jgi:outer membrane protein W
MTFTSEYTGEIDFGTLDTNIVSVIMQLHSGPERNFDVYGGVGMTYVDFSIDEDAVFEDQFPGFSAETILDDQAGATFQIGFDWCFGSDGAHSVGADIRYTMLDATGQLFLDNDLFTGFNVELNPLYFGFNYGFRF